MKTAQELLQMSPQLRYYYNHHEKCINKDRNYYQANREKCIAKATLWNKQHPENRRINERKHKLKKKFGLTAEQYDLMVKEQNNLCALCGKTLSTEKHRRPAIDHDHITNKVRGILHSNCNTALGLLQEDIQMLKNAINYLEKNKE